MGVIGVMLAFIILHQPDGFEVRVVPEQITSMHVSRDAGNYPKSARCRVDLADGKHVAVIETCEEIQRMLEERK